MDRRAKCPFCAIDQTNAVSSNQYVMVIRDKFPVSVGHSLIIPLRHVERPDELKVDEWQHVMSALQLLAAETSSFNFGVNSGVDAGQSIPHCHFHFIPRRAGDVPDPFGGVRNVIPGRGRY